MCRTRGRVDDRQNRGNAGGGGVGELRLAVSSATPRSGASASRRRGRRVGRAACRGATARQASPVPENSGSAGSKRGPSMCAGRCNAPRVSAQRVQSWLGRQLPWRCGTAAHNRPRKGRFCEPSAARGQCKGIPGTHHTRSVVRTRRLGTGVELAAVERTGRASGAPATYLRSILAEEG